MLADLRALRALQEAQEAALRDGHPERVEELCADGRAILARIAAGAIGETPGQEDAVRAMAPQVIDAQERLEALAAEMRRAVLEQLRSLGPGRDALAGYRPPARDTSRMVDRAR